MSDGGSMPSLRVSNWSSDVASVTDGFVIFSCSYGVTSMLLLTFAAVTGRLGEFITA